MHTALLGHHRPTSLEAALALIERLGESARIIAGGTDLVPQLRAGKVEATHLVSVSRIPEISGVELAEGGSGGLVIGAFARLNEVAAHPYVVEHLPALAHACARMATTQIRNMATVGGNLANGSPCADTVGPLLVYDAVLELCSMRGRRQVPLTEFHLGPKVVDLRPGEILVAVRVPAAAGGSAYLRLSARSLVDMAAVSVAARLVLGRDGAVTLARLALGAVAPTPIRCRDAEALLVGHAPTAERFAEAAAACAAAARPIEDVRASADWRRAMVNVLGRRALEGALHDANARLDGRSGH